MVGKNTAGGTLQDDRIELTVAGAARSATPQETSQGAASARTSWRHEKSERRWVRPYRVDQLVHRTSPTSDCLTGEPNPALGTSTHPLTITDNRPPRPGALPRGPLVVHIGGEEVKERREGGGASD